MICHITGLNESRNDSIISLTMVRNHDFFSYILAFAITTNNQKQEGMSQKHSCISAFSCFFNTHHKSHLFLFSIFLFDLKNANVKANQTIDLKALNLWTKLNQLKTMTMFICVSKPIHRGVMIRQCHGSFDSKYWGQGMVQFSSVCLNWCSTGNVMKH